MSFNELDSKYRLIMQNYMRAIDANNKRLVDVLSKKLDKIQEQMLEALKPVDDAELSKQEWIEERAAILEFDAGMTRKDAEATALRLWNEFKRRAK